MPCLLLQADSFDDLYSSNAPRSSIAFEVSPTRGISRVGVSTLERLPFPPMQTVNAVVEGLGVEVVVEGAQTVGKLAEQTMAKAATAALDQVAVDLDQMEHYSKVAMQAVGIKMSVENDTLARARKLMKTQWSLVPQDVRVPSQSEHLQTTLIEALRSGPGIEKAFQSWDKDNSGTIDKREFYAVTRSLLGLDVSQEVSDAIFNKLDADKSGTLDHAEIDKALEKAATDGTGAESKKKVSIPSWSTQDRFERYVIISPRLLQVLRSNVICIIFYLVYLLSLLSTPPGNMVNEACGILPFMFWHLIIILATAIPDNGTTSKEIASRIDGITFLSMVLYPAIGMWVVSRVGAWEMAGFDAFATARDEQGLWRWGFIFPVIMWGMSSAIIISHGYHGFAQDRSAVVTNSSFDRKGTTRLFRRLPPDFEIFLVRLLRALMVSWWDLIPDTHRPAGGVGRFLFQLASPCVIMFQYIGFRFVVYSMQEIIWLWGTTSADTYTQRGTPSEEYLTSNFILWCAYLLITLIVRALVPTQLWVRWTVPDKNTQAHRLHDWQKTLLGSRQTRVLWGFRGFALAFGRFSCYMNGHETMGGFVWYLYVAVYISFFFEGCGAFFFGLMQAEKGCALHTPLSLCTKWFFWLAYNCYLQPVGTAFNMLFYVLNREYLLKKPPFEIFGPLLDHEGNLPVEITSFFTKSVPLTPKAEAELLDEWMETYKRKRTAVGKSADKYQIVKPDPVKSNTEPLNVFAGTMLPCREQWLVDRDPSSGKPVLLPHEVPLAAEKFLRWYPACFEEVKHIMKTARNKYNFGTDRVVYMFGHGSLMSPDAPPGGLTTTQKKQIIPYWLKCGAGYKRVWNYRHGTAGITALGLEQVGPEEAMDICGAVYPIDYESACDLFGVREDGYELLLVHQSYFKPMHNAFTIPDNVGYIWICGQPTRDGTGGVNDKRFDPTPDFPILQTYVDTIVSGVMRTSTAGAGKADGMNFAAALIGSIGGWDKPWLNDRIVPGRPWSWKPEWQLIDGLLSTCPASAAGFRKRLQPTGSTPDSWAKIQLSEEKAYSAWSEEFFTSLMTQPKTKTA